MVTGKARVGRLDDASSVDLAFWQALRPPPNITVSEWAARFRVLTSEVSADAGRWDNALTPYLVEIMDTLSPQHPAQRVVFQKSARIGGTEVWNNTVGCYMDVVKCPIMSVQPTESDAEEWSKDHLDAMIQASPRLRALLTSDGDRKKGNTILHKKYRGGTLHNVGASSARSFRRRTIRLLGCDEIDGYPGELAGEGDPISLAEQRTRTFTWNRKIFLFGTPTVRGSSRTETAFLDSDQRHYLVPCPECSFEQRLVWSQLQFAHGPEARVDQDGNPEAEYLCVSCGSFIPHHKKPWMVSRGRWIASRESQTVGFQISALYSPWVTWGQLAREWIEKHRDPVQYQTFVNLALGETYDLSESDQWDPSGFSLLVERLTVLPSRVAFLTAGVDVQGDRLVLQVDAWGPHFERWTVERRDLIGNPSADPDAPGSVWLDLDAALKERYPIEGGHSARISATCIDTGGHSTDQVMKFCRTRRRRMVMAIKGDHGREGSPVWAEKVKSRKYKGRADLHMVGVFAGKEATHERLKRSLEAARDADGERRGPGYWHFLEHPAIGPAYFEELTAEVCTFEYSSSSKGEHVVKRRRKWSLRSKDRKNESLDVSVYSYAAALALIAMGMRLDKPARSAKPATVTLVTEPEGEPRRTKEFRPTPPNLPKSAETPKALPAPLPVEVPAPRKRPPRAKAPSYM